MPYLAQVVREQARDLLAEREIDGFAFTIHEDGEPLRAGELDREHLDARQGLGDPPADLPLQCPLLLVNARHPYSS